jgi:uncharacterized membrane protein YkvA (DUF1232 family)
MAMRRLIWVLLRTSRQDLRLAWFALKHPERPGWLMPALVLLALYALAPFNVALPMVGVVDELVVVPLVLHFLVKLLPQRVWVEQHSHLRTVRE